MTEGLNLKIEGIYFDGHSSRNRAALLQVVGEQVLLQVQPDGPLSALEERWQVSDLRIEPPLGRIRRIVKLPGGGRFETPDDAAISRLEAGTTRNRGLGRVRHIESRWSLTLAALAALGVFTWGFLTYGLPALARQAAAATPRSVLASFDREAIKLLDNGEFMGPSRLSAARQAQLQQQFRQVRDWAGGAYPYTLLLRDGKPQKAGGRGFSIGANAFALPNGTVVMTDQLVALAGSDRELMGVLAHETGHVTHRHALSSVYQGLGLSLLGVALTGDLVSATSFAAAVPTTLLSNGYSRRAETQSDEVAGAYMMQAYGTTSPLRRILARLEKDDLKATEDSIQDAGRAEDMLNTHPGTKQRIEHLRAIEEQGKPTP
ncbi:M48 family metallopeptidase [Deinococcus fonticola]|uniref:M48 family metallopeptidase n=1 Tax=Deinococcus fonticola TaxID=2528713 RepID=UPI0010751A07|nr:M48 family metallopeptidase [Deinococcus fonticola]